jgi:putative acetyltransferase
VLVTRATIDTDTGARQPVLALAPLGVRTAWQGCGVGTALVIAALTAVARYRPLPVVLLGHPGYYPRFGFTDATAHDVRPPFALQPGAYQLWTLSHGPSPRPGVVRYPPAFG